MKIEVWSDFVCPFCYVGKRRLEQALEQFPHREQVEVEFKSFELDQTQSHIQDKASMNCLLQNTELALNRQKQMNENVGEQAAGVGLNYNFDTMKHTNTFDAHRLAKFAATEGKEKK